MIALMRSRYFWPNMERSIHAWCKTCKCRLSKATKPKSGEMKVRAKPPPLDTISLDFYGHFPRTPKRGNVTVMSIYDVGSHWPELYPMPDATAESAAWGFYLFIMRHGCPRVILSDNGSAFLHAMFRELTRLLGVRVSFVTAYRAQANPVERYHRYLGSALRVLVNDRQSDWDLLLEPINFAYRTSVVNREGFTPFELLQARQPRLPMDVLYGPERLPEDSALPTEVQDRLLWARRCYQNARELYKSSHGKIKAAYDKGRRSNLFQIGQRVALERQTSPDGLSQKLLTRWYGPFEVVWRENDTYRVRNPLTNRLRSANADSLILYPEQPIPNKESPLPVLDLETEERLLAPPHSTLFTRKRIDSDPDVIPEPSDYRGGRLTLVVGDYVIMENEDAEWDLVMIKDTSSHGNPPGAQIEVQYIETRSRMKSKKSTYFPAWLDPKDNTMVLTYTPRSRWKPWTQVVPRTAIVATGVKLTAQHTIRSEDWKRVMTLYDSKGKSGFQAAKGSAGYRPTATRARQIELNYTSVANLAPSNWLRVARIKHFL